MSASCSLRGCALVALLSACSAARSPLTIVDVSSGQAISLTARDVGPIASFEGNYYSAQTGELHLDQRAAELSGHYRGEQDGCVVDGSVRGIVAGNQAKLEWSEQERCEQRNVTRSGSAELLFDGGPGGSAPIHLVGQRSILLHKQVTYGERTVIFDELGPALPWTAIRLVLPGPLLPQGAGQSGRLSGTSANEMAARCDVVERALEHVPPLSGNPTSSGLQHAAARARRALAQANEALLLWQSGDPRRWRQVEYCLSEATADVARELSTLGLTVPVGLLDVAPNDPPSTWSDASCPARER